MTGNGFGVCTLIISLKDWTSRGRETQVKSEYSKDARIYVSRKNIFPILSIAPPCLLLRLTANGDCQAFPHLLCTLYSSQAISHSYVYFMHSSECRRLQREVRVTKERMVEGDHRKLGRSKGGREVGRRVHPTKESVRGKHRRRMDGPVARL